MESVVPLLTEDVKLQGTPPQEHGSAQDRPFHNDGSEIPTDEVAARGRLGSNPALVIKKEIKLDINSFPDEILKKINVEYAFRPMGKGGELVVPVVGMYQCVFDDAPTSLEEKSEVWAGSEYGTTTWLISKRLGTFPTRVDKSILQNSEGLEGTESNVEVIQRLTSKRKSTTVGRYIASLVSGGDNHITLLTAAYCVLFDRIWCEVVNGKRELMSSVPAENRVVTTDMDWGILSQEVDRPIVVVRSNPRFVNFWRTVCGDGMNFASLVESGGRKFGSPWGMLGFKGLLKALIVSEAKPDDGDLEFLEMKEALEDYVGHYGLFGQAEAASRLASRLPWLVKYKFVDTLPQPIHSADLVRGLQMTNGSPPNEDITLTLPPRFMIGTLLIAGHLLETRFNHWVSENIDLDVAVTSRGAAYRQLFYLWETGARGSVSPWNVPSMKEVNAVGEFLGCIRYSERGDLKFRGLGINTSFWEAAIVGPIPGTAAHAVLSKQQPNTSVVGATVLSVSAGWFAKIRASNIFGNRIFDCPFDDFPFPTEKISATHLTEAELRFAYARKDLPCFELIELHFGPHRPISSFQRVLLNLIPTFPSGGGMRTGGRFRDEYLSGMELSLRKQSDVKNMTSRAHSGTELVGASGEGSVHVSPEWELTDSPVEGDIIPVARGNDSALRAFVDALRALGREANLEDMKDIARSQGWDGERFVTIRDLARLCKQFEVGLMLENQLTGCLRYRGPSGISPIRLAYLENRQFGWVRERSENTKGVSKLPGKVHFHDAQ